MTFGKLSLTSENNVKEVVYCIQYTQVIYNKPVGSQGEVGWNELIAQCKS